MGKKVITIIYIVMIIAILGQIFRCFKGFYKYFTSYMNCTISPILLVVRCDNLGVPTRSNNPDWVQDMFGEEFVQAVTDRVTFAVQHFDGQVKSRG